MMIRPSAIVTCAFCWLLPLFGAGICSAELSGNQSNPGPIAWRDPSPHSTRFVTVDKDVNLEVLDWGGTGRAVVLLSGLGNTAHVYDDFAQKLVPKYHVYGITRRGYGASSTPVPSENNYSADRLGDDVLAVIEALKLVRPVLVGHSIAGEELSSIGSRHPERVAGLVYLDAVYGYAYYDSSRGWLTIDVAELQKKLSKLVNGNSMGDWEVAQQLLQSDLPLLERELRAVPKGSAKLGSFPNPTPEDLASFKALSAWLARIQGVKFPESDLRAGSLASADGRPAGRKTPASVPKAILSGGQRYTQLPVPVLAICAYPKDLGPFAAADLDARAASEALDAAIDGPQCQAFEKAVPSARVVRIAHSNHYVFISNEAAVLREMHAFIRGLPQ